MGGKLRIAQIGFGGRGSWYFDRLLERYQDQVEIVGVCDRNEGRLRRIVERGRAKGKHIPAYSADAFELMIKECRPDDIFVTTMDRAHDYYICRGMEFGCDIITEKPMTIDEERCQRILETRRRTKRRCRVTFNYRYTPVRTQVKDLLMSGAIGDILSVHFHWMLDTRHGVEYFRRWHRQKENSGGLLVHKAAHHFDLANWWLSSVPDSVFAMGQRRFYTPQMAMHHGITRRGERCMKCNEHPQCPFYLNLESDEHLRSLYLEQEEFDQDYRDLCVFDDRINIEDSMQVMVQYVNGTQLLYSLNAFMPWEGYTIVFNGTKGQLEHRCEERVSTTDHAAIPGSLNADGTYIRLYAPDGTASDIDCNQDEGAFSEGDDLLLEDLFGVEKKRDPYLRAADERAGAYSILTGIAANLSMTRNCPIQIDSLVAGLQAPEMPSMQTMELLQPTGLS